MVEHDGPITCVLDVNAQPDVLDEERALDEGEGRPHDEREEQVDVQAVALRLETPGTKRKGQIRLSVR